MADKPNPAKLVAPPHPTPSPLEGISDLDNLPLKACVELTHRLLTSISSLPIVVTHLRAVLKTIPICGCIWQHALGRNREKPCALPAGMQMGCTAGSWNCSTFSINTISIYTSKVRHSLIPDKPCGLPVMSATTRQTNRWR